jgi:hypothetical protein
MRPVAGASVRFKNPTHAKYWFLKQEVGVVVEAKQSYRSLGETMLTVKFGEKSVYAAEHMFELVTLPPQA